MVHMCRMIIFPSIFFCCCFVKILISRVVRRVKGQKLAQNDKKLCMSCLISPQCISGTIHHMIFIYGTHGQYLPVFSHFFQILIFGVVSGVKGQKVAKNDKKILSVTLHVSGSIHNMIVIFSAHV